MKNIVIIGPSRVGKSSLSSLLCQTYKNMHYLSGDSIRNAFIEIYPELNYDVKTTTNRADFCKFINFITNESNIHFKKNVYYVIDSTNISVASALKYFGDSLIIALGEKEITAEEMLNNIKLNDTVLEWTYGYSDKDLLGICFETIKSSERLYKQCLENNIPYFDTSLNRSKTFKDILDYIEKNMEVIRID